MAVINRRPRRRNYSKITSPVQASVTPGAEATNAINVAIQLKDVNGNDLGSRGSVEMYLSDDSGGDSLAASAPSGGWAIGTDGLLLPITANKHARFVSESDGDIDVTVTESTAKTFYLIVVFPDGTLSATAVTFV